MDSRKVVRNCRPAFVSILLPSRNFNLKPRHLGRISTQSVGQMKADTQFPAGQVKLLPQEIFNYKATTGVQGLRQISSSSHKVSTEAPEGWRCHVNPKAWSQAILCNTEIQHTFVSCPPTFVPPASHQYTEFSMKIPTLRMKLISWCNHCWNVKAQQILQSIKEFWLD